MSRHSSSTSSKHLAKEWQDVVMELQRTEAPPPVGCPMVGLNSWPETTTQHSEYKAVFLMTLEEISKTKTANHLVFTYETQGRHRQVVSSGEALSGNTNSTAGFCESNRLITMASVALQPAWPPWAAICILASHTNIIWSHSQV
jgi:hypothetical protein